MRYRLATYRECKAHREWNTTCPDCGRKGKFSPYIDTVTMEPVDDSQCGRCNRLSNCGYHLPPREVARTEDFDSRKSRERRENLGSVNYTSHRSHESHRSCIAERSQLPSGVYTRHSRQQGRSDLPFREIREICERQKGEICETKKHQREVEEFYDKMYRAMNQSQPWGHHLATWLRTKFPREQVDAVMKRYHVGGTPDGATLWWQIDEQGRVHTGKAMQYNPLTGHRVKEETPSVLRTSPPLWGEGSAMPEKPLHRGRGWGGSPSVNWAHRMRLYAEPTDLIVPQCLFGLSLLNTEHTVSTTDFTDYSDYSADSNSTRQEKNPCHPGNPWSERIGVVESEKTALILSLLCPDKVWLATGGKANLKEAMLMPLLGYEVEVYPDADALTDWYARAVEMNRTLGTHLHIPTWYYDLMNHDEARRAGLDLADVLLG